MTQVALVTGGSRGIGRSMCERFLAEGWKVAVNYSSDDSAAAKIVSIDPDRCRAYRCDVVDETGVQTMVDSVIDELGPIDVLVNNAGVWRGGLTPNVSGDDFRRVFDVAVVGSRNCSVAVTAGMAERGYGHIINVSSSVALMGWRGDVAYASAKAGVIGLTRALAKELAGAGIRVNAIAPGFIDTDMTRAVSPRARQRLAHRTLLDSIGRPEDVAGMVYAIATEGHYMTGAVLVVDGGLTLGRDEPLASDGRITIMGEASGTVL